MRTLKGSALVALLVVIAVLLVYLTDIQQWLTLEQLKTHQIQLQQTVNQHPIRGVLLYSAIYIVFTSLALPGAPILTLAGGALFGLFWGSVLVSFISTIGASIAFLLSRNIFRDWVQKRFARQLKTVNQGIEKDGLAYLVTIRLLPIFPYFMINVLMGITPIKLWPYYWVSQLSMLPATVIYVNAGTQVGKITSVADIMTLEMFLAFLLLGLFPWLAKLVLNRIKHIRLYRQWQKPASFDNNLIVIGAGSGGLVTAYIAAALKAKVTLIEKNRMGGDCLNTGCVPSKTLIKTSRILYQIASSHHYGVSKASAQADFAAVMQHVAQTIKKIAPHDSVERYRDLGVNVIQGEARLESPWHVRITDNAGSRVITGRNIVIATGAGPAEPEIEGLRECPFYTSDTIWSLQEKPQRLVVLGGGPIGCELAQAFARLGVDVTIVERDTRLLAREDEDVSEQLHCQLVAESIALMTGAEVTQIVSHKDKFFARLEQQGEKRDIEFDAMLLALGRQANVRHFGLEELGIQLSPRNTVAVNPFMQTSLPNIYACGDVAGPYQFTHAAAHQAWFSAVNALLGRFKKFKADYSYIPWATFVDPEVARVGLNEQEARARHMTYDVSKYSLNELDRAITDGVDRGFIKVLTVPGKDKILGVTIVGEHAGDLIAEYVLAMKHNIGMNKILGTPHIYPTLAEANKYVAGVWKQQHKPEWALTWLARYHQWMRHDR